jgi:hypothetical protein
MSLNQIKIVSFTFACLLFFVSESNAQETQDEQHIEVSLRMIGHQVLLSSKDSTARVLPIIKEKDRYRIQFESEFEFNPSELVSTINRVMKETQMAKNYIVEVEECRTGEVVYSYEMNELKQTDIIPCGSRAQPKSCYSLLFTLIKTKETGRMNSILLVLLVGVIGLTFFFLRKKRNTSTIDPNLIHLGAYQFNKRNSELLFENRSVELTNKEAELLLLLYDAVNTSVEREVLLNRVWGDEGDYVGRTLDVFISKLRKKLEDDSSVKIVNIRGIGYKLILNN